MAEPGSESTGTPAAAPAAPAQESSSSVFDEARAQLAALDRPAEETSPAAATQEAAPPETPATATETPAPSEEKGSRREQGTQLRDQIRREIDAEYEQKRQADAARQQADAAQRDFETLMTRAEAGDYQAAEQVIGMLRTQRVNTFAEQRGRTGLLQEIGRDVSASITSLDGLDADGRTALMEAPSVAEFGKRAFDHGQRIARGQAEDTIAKLTAENTSLKGKLAASTPSPTASNGTAGAHAGEPTKFKSMRDAYAAAAAELGYRGG